MAELAADEGRVKALSIVEESAGIEVSCPHCQGKHVVRNGTADACNVTNADAARQRSTP
jgi:hypothetical protein